MYVYVAITPDKGTMVFFMLKLFFDYQYSILAIRIELFLSITTYELRASNTDIVRFCCSYSRKSEECNCFSL